jgi:hypothetical protein
MINPNDLIRRGDARLAIMGSLKSADALARLDQVQAVEAGGTAPSDLPPHAVAGFVRALRYIRGIRAHGDTPDDWRGALDEIKRSANAALAAWEGKNDE